MQIETMEHRHRLLLLIAFLLCFGNFGVRGDSTLEPNHEDSSPSSPSPSPIPDISPTPARNTYPRTPLRSSVTAIPSAASSSIPFEVPPAVSSTTLLMRLSSDQSPVYTPVKPTPSKLPQPATPTTLPGAAPTSAVPSSVLPTLASTTLPVNSPPSSASQRCQLTFSNKYNDMKGTEYDLWTHRPNAQRQLADFCGITIDRITNVAIVSSPLGNLVLRFSIEQGWPVYTEEALQNLKNRLSTKHLQLVNQQLMSPVAVYWTDKGPCPNDTCLNGSCDVTLAGEYKCSCYDGYTGTRCQDEISAFPMPTSTASPNNALFALLVLLIIPIAIAVIVGFIVGRRKQQKLQLKKAFDLRDVRTIGPRSMLSLPMESGIRNEMYDTRSFALAFTDTTFSKSPDTTFSKSPPSTTNDDGSSNALY